MELGRAEIAIVQRLMRLSGAVSERDVVNAALVRYEQELRRKTRLQALGREEAMPQRWG